MRQVVRQISLASLAISTVVGCSKMQMEFVASDMESREASIQEGRVVINDDAAFTNQSAVTLSLTTSGGGEMYVTNDPSCQTGGEWEIFQSKKSWRLDQTNAAAKVFVRFRDAAIESPCFEDQITHDDTAPRVAMSQVPPKFVAGSEIHLTLDFEDSVSGVAETSCFNNGSPLNCGLTSFQWDLSKISALADYRQNVYTVVVSAKDRAGNVSEPKSLTFKVLPKTQGQTQSQVITSSSNAPDVLFVVDTSTGTMNYQFNRDFQEGFGALSDALFGLDWRAGLISADATAATSANPMKDGQLVLIQGLNPAAYILSALTQGASDYFASTMTYMIANRWSYKPKAISSAIRAMERSGEASSAGLIRDEALLAVVIYSDQDEFLEPGETSATKIAAFHAAVKNNFGSDKKASVYSVIRPDGDTECRKDGNKEGKTYDLLAKQTGGIVSSICAPNFSEVMTSIGRSISEKVLNLTLSCAPYYDAEEMAAAVTIKKDGVSQNIQFSVVGNQLRFQNPLAPGSYEFLYSCVQ